ncbi:MAG: hypothetical protein Q9160_003843 [Pyrenula sp. 1 TL-2023]
MSRSVYRLAHSNASSLSSLSAPTLPTFSPFRSPQAQRLFNQCLRHRKSPGCSFPRRSFHFSPPKHAEKTYSSNRGVNRTGVRILLRALVFCATGAGLVFYFTYEKARLERKRVTEMSKGYGKPKVGGPFELKDLEGKEFTHEELKGKYNLIYFGFTHCPDICPDELDKMSRAISLINEQSPHVLRPLFITCDPARDSPDVLRSYLSEFHPLLLGLTGTWEQVKNVCKQYRVYFSTPPGLKPGEEDYLVDHSIYFYVMDPEGDFVECIGRQNSAEEAAKIILQHVRDWQREKKPLDLAPIKGSNS